MQKLCYIAANGEGGIIMTIKEQKKNHKSSYMVESVKSALQLNVSVIKFLYVFSL
jgi:hypothetical protein